MPDRDFYVGQPVLILRGPYSNNLTYGYAGRIDSLDSPAGADYVDVRIEVGGSSYLDSVVIVHKSQLASLHEAMEAVIKVRAGEADA